MNLRRLVDWFSVDRFNRWQEDRRQRLEARLDAMDVTDEPLSIWWHEPRMRGVEDTGSIVATPEDKAEIGPFDPVPMPGQRRRRHASDLPRQRNDEDPR
jgi:hypothetical protein